jgi:hypothetical protein
VKRNAIGLQPVRAVTISFLTLGFSAIGFSALSLVMTPPAVAALPPAIAASADTTTNSQSPTTNYGSSTVIYASPASWKALLRFPTAQIDDGATLTSATLRVFGTTTSTSRWEVHPASSAWSEATTYTTMPNWNATVLASSPSSSTADGWNSISLPVSAISKLVDTNLGLRGTVTGKIGLRTRETTNAPSLVLTYGPTIDPTAADTTITSSVTNGTSAVFSFSASGSGSTFACQLDGSSFAACTSSKSYSGLAVGTHTFAVRSTDSVGHVDATPASYTWSVAVTTGDPMPNGPAGPWTLAFDDEFNGTALDTSKWAPHWFVEGGNQNNVGTYASNVSVANGNLMLRLASATSGASVNTESNSGYAVRVGGYAEARVYFPGSSTEPIYNFPAWWISGNPWPAGGEHDIAEGLGGDLTVNYHSPSGSHNQGAVPGTWDNAFHTYGVYRKASSADVYWDGKLVKSYPTDDNAAGEYLILNVGASGSRAAVTGAAGAIKVDYVRAWR